MAKAKTIEQWVEEQMQFYQENANECIQFQYESLVHYFEGFMLKKREMPYEQTLTPIEFDCLLDAVKCHLALLKKIELLKDENSDPITL